VVKTLLQRRFATEGAEGRERNDRAAVLCVLSLSAAPSALKLLTTRARRRARYYSSAPIQSPTK
jgi:hypothetical protein